VGMASHPPIDDPSAQIDAFVVALRPRQGTVLDAGCVARLAELAPGGLVAQLWGDIDRSELRRAGLKYWPSAAPAPGHMGILLGEIGPEPIVRLQSGGLKTGQIMADARRSMGQNCGPESCPSDEGVHLPVVLQI